MELDFVKWLELLVAALQHSIRFSYMGVVLGVVYFAKRATFLLFPRSFVDGARLEVCAFERAVACRKLLYVNKRIVQHDSLCSSQFTWYVHGTSRAVGRAGNARKPSSSSEHAQKGDIFLSNSKNCTIAEPT
jgi:hypothetical protein